MAESKELEIGDLMVYPKFGVAKVGGMLTMTILGETQDFYELHTLATNTKMKIPVGNIEEVRLRPLIKAEQVEEIYDLLRIRDVEIDMQAWNRRQRAYGIEINSGDAYRIAEVIRDVNLLRTRKALSSGEKGMLEIAKRLLVQEIGLVRDQDPEKVSAEIDQIFEI